jgi:hypothetical protein
MVLCADPLKGDDIVRPASKHGRAFKKEVMTYFKEMGLKCVVGVRAIDLDNMVITLTFSGNGMSPDQVKGLVSRAFSGGFETVRVHVEGA